MLTSLKIFDVTTASIGKKAEHSFTVRVSGEKATVRELIRLRIFQEVEEYNRSRPEAFRMLVQTAAAEQTLNGYKFKEPRLVDPQAQFEKALRAFESNGFIVLVDERQVGSLEEQISLRPETSVTFLKLVPLVGG
jgi:hypothetical protein